MDRISGIKNDIRTNFGRIGIQGQPISDWKVISLVGYKFDKRFNQFDQGVTYLFDLNIPSINWDDYQNFLQMYINGDNFKVRKNSDFIVKYRVNKEFYTDTSDTLLVSFLKNRRDNYDRLDERIFIESLNIENLTFNNILNYKINKYVKVKLLTALSSKITDISRINTYDRRSKTDFSSNNEIAIYLQRKKVENTFKLSHTTIDQKNEVPDSLKSSPFSYRISYISPDYKSSRLSLSDNLQFFIFNNDTIITNALIGIFRYDTPDVSNYDDRDEFRMNGFFSMVHYFSPLLKLKLNAGVNMKHLVFIYGQRSADNNWMRVIHLQPEVYYQPTQNLKLYQSFEVLANYVDYDFENRTVTTTDVKSFVYRKFMMHQISHLDINRLLSVNVNYKLELEENGKLIWDEWTEMIISTRQNHYGKINFNFNLFTGATVSIGTIFFKRSEDFQIATIGNNDTPVNNDYFSYGPSIAMNYAPSTRLSVIFSGSRRVIDQINRKKYFINNVNVNVSWYL